ncbi:toxin Cry1Ac domain D-VI-related protein [Peribacillus sp. NPDC060253]|uniref:toxin Cry1Ac domain D-VI-related protein n=1 Tax=Peribacillus sp. NPDC060253 TaxID=3347084 RepID=UPI0036516664
MKKSKMLKPINVMTTSFLLASSLLIPSVGLAEEPSTVKNKESSNAKESGVKTQEGRKTTEIQAPNKAVAAINANERVVNNFTELKAALEGDNGITTVIFGKDIDVSGSIKIQAKKTHIVIDGNNHTLTQTGGTGGLDSIYYGYAYELQSTTVKNLNVKGNNPYGVIAIGDGLNNVEQIFENVSYSGPQMIYNRGGKATFKDFNAINITSQEMAETGSVEFHDETIIAHNSAYSLIWSVSEQPDFIVAPNANVNITTLQSGQGIFYPTKGYGAFIIGENAKVNINGHKGFTGQGILRNFIVDSGAELDMNRTGKDTLAMISFHNDAKINEKAKLNVSTENGVAVYAPYVGKLFFNNPKKVVISSLNSQAFYSAASLDFNMVTDELKIWENTSNTPAKTFVGREGQPFKWSAVYHNNQLWSEAPTVNMYMGKTKKIELGDRQAEKELADAKNKAEGLFTDGNFNTLKNTTNQSAIDEAKNAVDKLPEGAEKNRLKDLVNKAQDLLNKKIQAEKDLNDAKNKVEDLFTDDKFDTLKGSTDQGAIDEAKEAVSKLPAGPEKDRLQDLLNKAQDLLNKKIQAEKELNDTKNKVESLFTDDKFDTLKGSTDQGAIDEAKEAVSKLPAGPEKDRLEELLINAQDLLKKNEQAEKELNDAKNKVEDLFTDDKFDTLKGSTDQGAIDEAEEAVSKLPAGPEKDRLQDLLNKAQDLLNKKIQAEKELNDTKNKVESLFTDDKFDTLKGSTDQGAIDEAKEAVSKLPAGPEKDRLEELLINAQDLLKKNEQAEKELNDAKNKVEDLFTDDKFGTLKGSADQGAIDEAEEAVSKLPAGPEKDRLQDLLNKAQDLLNKKEKAEKELNDAKNKVEDLFTDDKFDTLKGSADQGAIDEAEEAVSKLPAGPEKDRLQDLLNKAQDLLNKKEQAEKELTDAKNKVEGLFTDNKFDTLKGSIDQAAVEEAQVAVNKLPAGLERDRLQGLVDKAEELLNKDVTPPAAPRLNGVTTASKEVTGTGEPDAKVTVTINGKTYTGVVGPDGIFKVDIPKQPVNTVMTVTLTDAAGNISERSTVTVSQFMPSEPVKLNSVYQNAEAITGTAPEGETIVRLLVNGVPLRTAPVNEDGSFSIYSKYVGVDENGKNKTLQAGDVVTVDYGIRTPSNIQAHTTVLKEIEKLQVNPVAPNADYVTGKAPVGTQLLRMKVNGNPLRTVSTVQSGAGVINPDGSYQIYSRFITEDGVQRRLQAGDVIEVDYGPNVVGGDIAKTIVR